jgi:asparagine synthase (glutamine-hydrolysing)
MCGVIALWRPGGAVSREEVERLAAEMAHRGPDSWGVSIFPASEDATVGDVGLGHRRLAVIDLSPGGHQPMHAEGLSLVFNGEIYNYIELREELRGLGREFRTASDTEVLLQAWAEWGHACLPRLNGIFAFVLWDDSRKRLFAARDHLGVKPLHWVREKSVLALASEAPVLLPFASGSRALNGKMVYEFLVAGRTDGTDETHFPGVHRLPAGTWMEAGPEGVEIRKFWAPSEAPVRRHEVSFEEAAKQFHDLFVDSIRLQMRADVPVACCLSGGLDSSSVVAVAARRSPYRMSVFTARFEDRSMDEWSWATVVHEGSPVDFFEVPVHAEGFMENLGALVRAQGEPFATPSVYSQWATMKAVAERGLRVVLDGQGGDELLCGYAKFFYYGLLEQVRAGKWLDAARWAFSGLRGDGRHLFNWTGARRYLPGGLGTSFIREHLLRPDFSGAHVGQDLQRTGADVREQQRLDLVRYSLPAILRFEDRNSMAHSVESRVPFLDPRLVEFCLDLPTVFKVEGGRSKRVLREAMVGEVPEKILKRVTKLGFGGSYRSWVRDLAPRILEWASDPSRPVFRLVRPEAVRLLVRNDDPVVFRVLVLDAWMSEFGVRV